jgi:hypothetical protein
MPSLAYQLKLLSSHWGSPTVSTWWPRTTSRIVSVAMSCANLCVCVCVCVLCVDREAEGGGHVHIVYMYTTQLRNVTQGRAVYVYSVFRSKRRDM